MAQARPRRCDECGRFAALEHGFCTDCRSLDPRAIGDGRLTTAANSEPGWNVEGDALSVTDAATALARRLLGLVAVGRAPWIGPAPDGGLQLIWLVEGREVQIDIPPSAESALVFVGDREPTEVRAADLDAHIAASLTAYLRAS